MQNFIINGVADQWGAFVSILRHYLEKCGVVQITDDKTPLDPRRKSLIHWKARIAMYAGILFQVLQYFGLLKPADEPEAILEILEVPMECATYGCLFDTS
ncbi:MAG: hypothetical protein GY850_26930 [bacterium]|nr:hypothetical protein [bacterium]